MLCPVIDLGNHAPKGEASCEVRGTAGGAIEVVALRAIAAGEEVSYCYGALARALTLTRAPTLTLTLTLTR